MVAELTFETFWRVKILTSRCASSTAAFASVLAFCSSRENLNKFVAHTSEWVTYMCGWVVSRTCVHGSCRVHVQMRYRVAKMHRLLILIGQFPQKSLVFRGYFAGNDQQLKASCESSPPYVAHTSVRVSCHMHGWARRRAHMSLWEALTCVREKYM